MRAPSAPARPARAAPARSIAREKPAWRTFAGKRLFSAMSQRCAVKLNGTPRDLAGDERQGRGRAGPVRMHVLDAVPAHVARQPERLRHHREVLEQHARRAAAAQSPHGACRLARRADGLPRRRGGDPGREQPRLERARDEMTRIGLDRGGEPAARADDDVDALPLELLDLGHDEALVVSEGERRGHVDDARTLSAHAVRRAHPTSRGSGR